MSSINELLTTIRKLLINLDLHLSRKTSFSYNHLFQFCQDHDNINKFLFNVHSTLLFDNLNCENTKTKIWSRVWSQNRY